MEDEDAKARRNFVAVSTVVVLTHWLGLAPAEIANRILGASAIREGLEFRVWLAAAAVLVYFALRFRFSESHRLVMDQCLKEEANVRDRLLMQWVAVEVFFLRRLGWKGPLIGKRLSEAIEERREGYGALRGAAATTESELGARRPDGDVDRNTRRKVEATIHVALWFESPEGRTMHTSTSVSFRLTVAQRKVLQVWTWAHLAIYSRASTALFLPWLRIPLIADTHSKRWRAAFRADRGQRSA